MSGFDKLNNFWEELKKRNVVRALIFYVVTAWLIIQFAATTFPYLNLPDWSVTVVIVALLIGLPIVLIISWIYELTTEGLKKTDTIDRAKSISVKTGKRINRLTIIILSLAVVFLLVDKFYLSAPVETETQRTESIAVFPFAVQGSDDIQYLREGMVDLISTKLDGIPGMNATDPNILLTRLEGRSINERDPESAAEIARELGANRVILGSVTQAGEELQVKLSKYDNNGNAIGETIVEHGSINELYGKVDDVIRRLVAEELEEQGSDIESLAVLTTNSIESIVPFLQGEQLRRKGQYHQSLELFKESISYDSTFAMAFVRYLETAGWLEEIRMEKRETEFTPYIKKLKALKDGLKGKIYELADAKLGFYEGDLSVVGKYRGLLTKYGESRDILNGLAESILHVGVIENKDPFEAKPYFERLLVIDPTNIEYVNHLIDIAAGQGDAEELKALIERGDEKWEYGDHARYQLLLLQDSLTDQDLLPFTDLRYLSQLMTMRYTLNVPEGLDILDRITDLSEHQFSTLLRDNVDFSRKLVQGQHSHSIDSLLRIGRDVNGNYTVNPGNTWLLNISFQMGHHDLHLFEGHQDELIKFVLAAKSSNAMGLPPFIIDYCLGVIYLSNKDYESLDSILKSTRTLFEDEMDTPFGLVSGIAKIGYYNLQGMKAFQIGELEKSMLYLDSAVTEGKGVSVAFSPAVMMSRHLYQAEKLVLEEEYSEALVSYKRVLNYLIDPIITGLGWGYLMYRIAGMHDKLGQNDEAIAYYKKFAAVYTNADEIYQPWVDDAYARLSVLMERPEQELRGNIDELED